MRRLGGALPVFIAGGDWENTAEALDDIFLGDAGGLQAHGPNVSVSECSRKERLDQTCDCFCVKFSLQGSLTCTVLCAWVSLLVSGYECVD